MPCTGQDHSHPMDNYVVTLEDRNNARVMVETNRYTDWLSIMLCACCQRLPKEEIMKINIIYDGQVLFDWYKSHLKQDYERNPDEREKYQTEANRMGFCFIEESNGNIRIKSKDPNEKDFWLQ